MLRSLLALLLLGCGGGGGAPGAPEPPAPPPARTEALHFGYYGDCPACFAETRDHVDLVWIAGWLDPVRPQAEAIVARAIEAAPMRTVIMLPGWYVGDRFNPAAVPLARGIFTTMASAGVLEHVAAIYPQDEPDLLGLSDAEVLVGNAALRALMAEFPALAGAKLAVIYAGVNDFPGLASYDWVGFDDYDRGEAVLGSQLQTLLAALQPHQRAMLVPGGADPWRAAPGPFLAAALADNRIVAVVPFIWFDNADRGVGLGIRSNGLREIYRQAGILARCRSPPATC